MTEDTRITEQTINERLGLSADACLADRVRLRRIELGMTQQDLAHAAHVSAGTVALIEQGRTQVMRLSTARAFSDALGVPVTWLHPIFGPAEVTRIPTFEEWLRTSGHIRDKDNQDFLLQTYNFVRAQERKK